MRYGGSVYPLLSQNADWNRNQYSRFDKVLIKVSKSLGKTSPGLSMAEFRDFSTIYAIDLSAQAIVCPTNPLTLNVKRRAVFATMLKHYKIQENLMPLM